MLVYRSMIRDVFSVTVLQCYSNNNDYVLISVSNGSWRLNARAPLKICDVAAAAAGQRQNYIE